MQTNFKEYEIGHSLQLQIDFDSFLPAHHFSKQLEKIVSELDLSSIYSHYSQTGCKAYHPQMLLCVIFYGYISGIRSGRKLEAACRRDLVFIYLSRGHQLGKSTINDFRKLHYAQFESLFLQILHKCEEQGIVDTSVSIVDGSKIDANSSKKRSKTKAQFEKWQQCLAQDIDELKKASALNTDASQAEQLATDLKKKKHKQSRLQK